MKAMLLLVLATALFAACIFFYYRSGELLTAKDYLAGVLHLVVGLSLTRAAVELARLAILARPPRAS